jgi:hypothetical protein
VRVQHRIISVLILRQPCSYSKLLCALSTKLQADTSSSMHSSHTLSLKRNCKKLTLIWSQHSIGAKKVFLAKTLWLRLGLLRLIVCHISVTSSWCSS